MPTPFIALCIDPGAVCGAAYLDLAAPRASQIVALDSGTFAGVYAEVRDPISYVPDAVVIEDTRGLPIYARNRLKGRAREKAVRDVGRIDAMCDLLEDAARGAGRAVHLYVPHGPKWSADVLKQTTGYEGRTNQHTRDAVRAGWGLTPAMIARSV